MTTSHHENLYDVPRETGHAIWDLTQQVAAAMRQSYGCDGISTRQHNEPAGDQDVWHFHQHVLPRWSGDQLYLSHADVQWAPSSDRASYARLVSRALTT